MKMIVVVALALVALAAAAPVKDDISIVRSKSYQSPEGEYNFAFDTEDGISRKEEGIVREAFDEENNPHKVIAVRGAFSFTDPDGEPISVTYEADENGFRAEGQHIPKPASR